MHPWYLIRSFAGHCWYSCNPKRLHSPRCGNGESEIMRELMWCWNEQLQNLARKRQDAKTTGWPKPTSIIQNLHLRYKVCKTKHKNHHLIQRLLTKSAKHHKWHHANQTKLLRSKKTEGFQQTPQTVTNRAKKNHFQSHGGPDQRCQEWKVLVWTVLEFWRRVIKGRRSHQPWQG